MYTQGNSATQYSLGGDLRVRGEHWRVAADVASSLSKSSGVPASTWEQGRIWTRRLIGGRRKWYYTGGAEFLSSSLQGIDLQTTVGGGFGRFLKDTNLTRLALAGGLAVQQTRYEHSAGVQSPPNALAGMFNADLHIFRFKKTSFDLTASVLPVLTELGRVRRIFHRDHQQLMVQVSFHGNWDNRPPATFSGSDYGVSSGVSYSFH